MRCRAVGYGARISGLPKIRTTIYAQVG
jgi:hypothetical protein